MKSSNIGGQAVLEGIMMRNGGKYSVAVRESDGEIAVDVQVLAPEEVGVTLSVQVKAKDGWDSSEVRTGVKNALQSWFSGERLAQDVLLAQLGSLIYGCEGVANYKIVSPAADVAIGADQLPVLSSISVEAMT